MGSPAPASPPTLDTAKSKELTAAELAIKRKEISPTTAAAGEASRSEAGKNMAFALRGFTNPASVIYGDQIKANSAKLKTRLWCGWNSYHHLRMSGAKYSCTREVLSANVVWHKAQISACLRLSEPSILQPTLGQT